MHDRKVKFSTAFSKVTESTAWAVAFGLMGLSFVPILEPFYLRTWAILVAVGALARTVWAAVKALNLDMKEHREQLQERQEDHQMQLQQQQAEFGLKVQQHQEEHQKELQRQQEEFDRQLKEYVGRMLDQGEGRPGYIGES